jgi:hypothetical protein
MPEIGEVQMMFSSSMKMEVIGSRILDWRLPLRKKKNGKTLKPRGPNMRHLFLHSAQYVESIHIRGGAFIIVLKSDQGSSFALIH